jgi:hypothetical protein
LPGGWRQVADPLHLHVVGHYRYPVAGQGYGFAR